MRALLLPAVLLVVSMSGCLSTDPGGAESPLPEDDPREARDGRMAEDGPVEGPTGGAPVETTARYEGRVTLRALGDGNNDPTYMEDGDSPQFCFGLPTNVALLRAVFTYAPRQQAGLEFQGPSTYVTSWDYADPLSLAAESPITLEVDAPKEGSWFVAGGPGSVGGAMDWSMDLTMVTEGVPSAEAIAVFQSIEPAC